MSVNKCYRVWFEDGTALLVDAEDDHKARVEALRLSLEQGNQGNRVTKVECLTAS